MVQPCLGEVAGPWTRVRPRGVLHPSGDAEVPWEAVCSCCGSVLLLGCTPEADWFACEWSLGAFAAAWPLLALSGGSAAAPALLRTSMCTSKSLRNVLRQSHAAEDVWEAWCNMLAVPATNEMAKQGDKRAVFHPSRGRGVWDLHRGKARKPAAIVRTRLPCLEMTKAPLAGHYFRGPSVRRGSTPTNVHGPRQPCALAGDH